MTLPRRDLLLPLALAALAACGVADEGQYVYAQRDPWPQPSLLPAVTGPRLAVTNSGDDTLSFVDPVSFTEIARTPIGRNPAEPEGPHHLAATPDGRTLFVGISNTVPVNASGPHGSHGTGTVDGYLLEVDALTGRQRRWTRVHRSPGDVRLEPGGARVWQSHYDLVGIARALEGMSKEPDLDPEKEAAWFAKMDSMVVVTDAATMERVAEFAICPAAHGIAFDPRRGLTWISCGFSDEVAAIDSETFAVTRVPVADDPGIPPTPRYEPYAVAIAPSGDVWISNTGSANTGLRVVDPDLMAEVPERRISTAGIPLFGSFLRDESRYFVVTQKPDALLAIDPATASIVAEVDLAPLGCLSAHAAVLSPDEEVIWIVCEGDHLTLPGTLERLDRRTLEPTGHLEVGLFPDDVVYVPEPSP
ncbi:MAG TPA: hypothetical protein VN033_05545 [Vulgatibacter sp.]|nr:hypothetical protein [Vulgatibacter sp.]